MLGDDDAYFRLICERTSSGVAVADWDGRIEIANAAFRRMFGCGDDELRGLELRTLVDLRDRDAEIAEIVRLRSREIEEFEIENRYRRADGGVGWARKSFWATPGDDRRPPRIVAVMRDITANKRIERALRESEERQKLLIDHAPVAVALFDREMRCLSASRRWLQEHDLSEGETLGRSFYELSPETSETTKATHRRALAGETVSAEADRYVRPDGSEQWRRWEVAPWRDANGDVGGVVIFTEDITRRKRSEDQHANARRLVTAGELAGGVAHDFNNLLTVIAGNLELAERGAGDEATRSLIRRALDAAELGANLTRRLLSLTRRRKLEAQRLDLRERVKESVKLLERALGKRFELVYDLGDGLWAAFADPSELDSALMNLAFNARDAMPEGGRLVVAAANATIVTAPEGARVRARPGDYVKLSVIDEGVGMTPDVLRRATEPLFTTKEPGKGTGLGLSGVVAFAEQSGGFVDIESEPGRGTRVDVYLPRAVETASADDERHAVCEIPMGDGELVLVVDDTDDVREVTMRRLESLGYTVTEARSGPEAIARLQSDEPIVAVVCDVVMAGGMSGYDVARWAAAARPDVRMTLASGYNAGDRVDIAGGALDDVAFLEKPYSRERLARTLSEALAAPQAGRTSLAKT